MTTATTTTSRTPFIVAKRTLLMTALLGLAAIGQAAVIVQWGAADDIVAAASNMVQGQNSSSLNLSTAANPAIGASYYSSNTGRSPLFYMSAVASSGDSISGYSISNTNPDSILTSVDDNGGGGATAYQATAWTQDGDGSSYGFLNNGDSELAVADLTSLSVTAVGGGFVNNVQLRWIIRLDGAWYVSSTTYNANLGSGVATMQTDAPGDMDWFNYDPTSDITAIGTAAALSSYSGLDAVGVYATYSHIYTRRFLNITNFTAEADLTFIPEPASLALFALGGLGLLRRRYPLGWS